MRFWKGSEKTVGNGETLILDESLTTYVDDAKVLILDDSLADHSESEGFAIFVIRKLL